MKTSRVIVILVLTVIAIGAVSAAALLLPGRGNATTTSSLPGACVKPAGGFLVVASQYGFNDSIDHGVPQKSWPILNVTQGQTVNITVCNTDFQAHGFQVTHYYDTTVTSIASGQIIKVSFVANQAGNFRIYCNIFCSIHWAMQSGVLSVSPA